MLNLKSVSALGLLLLFPGFFLYQSAVSLTSFPAILGGGFGVVVILLLPFLLVGQARSIFYGASNFNLIDALFFFLVVYCALWSSAHYFFGIDYQSRYDVYAQTVSTLAAWVVLFIIFKNAPLDSNALYWCMLFLWVVMSFMTITNQQGGFFYARGISTAEGIASYQGFARSYFVVSLFLISFGSLKAVYTVAAISFFTLYFLGSRSEFFLYLFLAPLLACLRFKHRFVVVLVMITPVLLAAMVFLGLSLEYLNPSNTRIFRILVPSEDTSYVARVTYSAHAVDTIMESSLLGDYGSHLLMTGHVGGYSHNLLSAWVSFGFVGFFSLSLLIFYGLLVTSYGVFFRRFRNSEYIFAFALVFFVCVLSVASKSVFYVMYGASFGLLSRVVAQHAKMTNSDTFAASSMQAGIALR